MKKKVKTNFKSVDWSLKFKRKTFQFKNYNKNT